LELLKVFTDPKGPRHLLENKEIDLSFVEDQKGASSIERVSVYSDAYFLRLKEILENDFELTRLVLGDALFLDLIVDYLKTHHPYRPNAQWVGGHLSEFVGQSSWAKKKLLSALVDFDWMLTEVTFETYLENRAAAKLPLLSPEFFSEATFVPDSSAKFLRCSAELEDLWLGRHNKIENPSSTLTESDKPWLLVRRGEDGRIIFYRLSDAERRFWLELAQSKALLSVCEILEEDEEASLAVAQLGSWIQMGLIKDIQHSSLS